MWSAMILEELEYAEAAKLMRRGATAMDAEARARHLVEQMRGAFTDAEVSGWGDVEGTFGLPDPNDEHVVAAAVVAAANAIITINSSDFPQSKLPSGLEVSTPAEFTARIVAIDAGAAWAAVSAIAGRSGRKGVPRSEDEILDRLVDVYDMGRTVEIIRCAL